MVINKQGGPIGVQLFVIAYQMDYSYMDVRINNFLLQDYSGIHIGANINHRESN